MSANNSISVIIPAYNRAELIAETLRSLLNQTTPGKEIIVVDDGSTDGTAEVVEREFSSTIQTSSGFSAVRPSLRIIRQQNAGPGAARNRGLSEATGEFIHFFDSDDIAPPNKHEVQLGALLETGADIAYGPWVKGRFLPAKHAGGVTGNESHAEARRRGDFGLTAEETESSEDTAGQRLGKPSGAAFSNPSTCELWGNSENTSLIRSAIKPADRFTSFRFQISGFSAEGPVLQAKGLPQGDLVRALLTNWSIVPHACLFRRSILEKAGAFPEDIWVGEDQLLFLKCLLAGAKVVHTPRTIVFYRLGNEGKLTESMEGQRRRVVDWGKFLVMANKKVTNDEWRVASNSKSVHSKALDYGRSMPANSPNWVGFRLRAYQAWRDLRAFFPGEYLELESGLEKIWRMTRFSGIRFQVLGFLSRKWGGLTQRLVGHRWSRAFRCGRANSKLLKESMQK